MSNLKFVAATVKRRGISIAAAVAIAGGSLATANYASAVEVEQIPSATDPTVSEYHLTDAGNEAVKAANRAADAIRQGQNDAEVQEILKQGLKNALGKQGADFTQQDIDEFGEDNLNDLLKASVDSGKNAWRAKNSTESAHQNTPKVQSPESPTQQQSQAPVQSPAPVTPSKLSPQRLEAEFGGTEEGKAAEETARIVADALRRGTPDAKVRQLIKERLVAAGFPEDEVNKISDDELTSTFDHAKKQLEYPNLELNERRQEALVELEMLTELNPLQRSIFKKQIEDSTSLKDVNTVFAAAKAENANPVQQFAPVPGQKAPEKAGGDTDVEKALEHTKKEALAKLEGFSFLSPQQIEAYKKQVEAATQVFEVEEAYEAGLAKNEVNKETKAAKNFVGKAVARTKHLALEKLDGFSNLTHEQKKEARNKILAAEQVFEVEAAFHGAEKLNKAAK
ncbi:hypothetical protein QP928_01550 [Corynebacterium propinquum]|uniref:hypothetical protein n=1 Tax=Corynebacterium propinquum TaxID=43769 RepID=UPI00255023AF|nr:hypothetical protein [Corynebacterium propinquum]MDK8665246.1 hypothetical protein [Corynebacterium propinquum]